MDRLDAMSTSLIRGDASRSFRFGVYGSGEVDLERGVFTDVEGEDVEPEYLEGDVDKRVCVATEAMSKALG